MPNNSMMRASRMGCRCCGDYAKDRAFDKREAEKVVEEELCAGPIWIDPRWRPVR